MKKNNFLAMLTLVTIMFSATFYNIEAKKSSWSSGNSNSNVTTKWSNTEPNWWWNSAQSMQGDIIKLQEKIHQDDITTAIQTMNKLRDQDRVDVPLRDRYQDTIHQIDQDNSPTETQRNVNEYLKTRLEYKIQLMDELWNLEQKMRKNDYNKAQNVMNTFEHKYNTWDNQQREEKLNKLLLQIHSAQERLDKMNIDEARKQRVQDMIQYIEIKTYQNIDDIWE